MMRTVFGPPLLVFAAAAAWLVLSCGSKPANAPSCAGAPSAAAPSGPPSSGAPTPAAASPTPAPAGSAEDEANYQKCVATAQNAEAAAFCAKDEPEKK